MYRKLTKNVRERVKNKAYERAAIAEKVLSREIDFQ